MTLLWPPRERGGYSLIVDGHGRCPGKNAALTIVPSRAVLHRWAEDCVPLES